MNITEPPLVDRRGRPDDDLDGILRSFFKSELPRPWPAAPVPERSVSPTVNGHGTLPFAPPVWPAQPAAQPWRLSSRVALAASLGGLVVGTVLMSGHFKGNQPLDPNLGTVPSGNLKIANPGLKYRLIQGPNGTSLEIIVDPTAPPPTDPDSIF